MKMKVYQLMVKNEPGCDTTPIWIASTIPPQLNKITAFVGCKEVDIGIPENELDWRDSGIDLIIKEGGK
jgi:hypothetical protein